MVVLLTICSMICGLGCMTLVVFVFGSECSSMYILPTLLLRAGELWSSLEMESMVVVVVGVAW